MTGNTVEVITFRTTRSDHPYWFPIEAMVKGTSVGHIALRFKFNNIELYNKYIRDVATIPKKVDEHGQEVYFSFWPNGQHSKLETHKFDCEISANYSPYEYNERFGEYLKPPTKILKSYLPIFARLSYSTATLPPALIVHITPLQHKYGKFVLNLACIYAGLYDRCRKANIMLENAALLLRHETDTIRNCKKYTNLVTICFIIVGMILKHFAPDLEKFVTYGNPEADKVVLPLADTELERMLDFVRHVAENPAKYPYNILRINCAYISLRTLMHGFAEHLAFHDFLHNLGVTITPTYLIQTLSHTLSAIAKQAVNPGDSIPNKETTVDVTEEEENEWLMISKSPVLTF